jgi:phosphatidate cytidylyltransferase
MHFTRLAVAVVFIPLFYFLVTLLAPFYFLLCLTGLSLLAQTEFHRMYKTAPPVAVCGLATGAAFLLCGSLLLSASLAPQTAPVALLPLVIAAAPVLIASVRLFSVKEPASALRDVAPAFVGVLYIPALLYPQYLLRLEGPQWILLLYGCVWASDSFAYYIGKGLGRRKLYKEVSPNKTVAGAVGSVLGGSVAGLALGALLMQDLGTLVAAMSGTAIGGITIVGDLVESMFKRDAGVKDSSAMIPGHGGILDKIDSVLFAGPILYVVAILT